MITCHVFGMYELTAKPSLEEEAWLLALLFVKIINAICLRTRKHVKDRYLFYSHFMNKDMIAVKAIQNDD